MKTMSIGSNTCSVKEHGADFIDWKCMWCCSVALYCCGGSLFFCDPCHNLGMRAKVQNCYGKNCPLKLPHPLAGPDPKKSAFPLGCSLCRSEHLEAYDIAQAAMTELTKEERKELLKGSKKGIDANFIVPKGFVYGGKKGKRPPDIKKAKKKPVAKKAKKKPVAPRAKFAEEVKAAHTQKQK